MRPTSHRRALLALVLAALLLRLGLMLGLRAYDIEDSWDFGYETGRIAAALAMGEGFSSPFRMPSGATAWMMPGFPVLLAGIFKLFGIYTTASAVVILSFNCLVSALTCLPLFLLADRIFDRTTAFVATAAFALYPPSMWHAITTIWDTTLFTFCGVWLLHRLYAMERASLGAVTLYGAAMGCVTWINPLILAFLPVVWGWIVWQKERPTSWRLAALAGHSLVLVLVVSPWLARNLATFDRLFLRSNLGLELQLGNSEEAWADYLQGFHTTAFVRGHPSLTPGEFEDYVALGEVRYMEEAFSEALAFITDNPSKFVRLSLRRVIFFWIGDLGARDDWTGNLEVSIPLSGLKKLFYILPVPLALLGIGAALREDRKIGPLLGFVLLLPITYYLTHVSSRYRFPIEPALVLLAGYGVRWTIQWGSSRWR